MHRAGPAKGGPPDGRLPESKAVKPCLSDFRDEGGFAEDPVAACDPAETIAEPTRRVRGGLRVRAAVRPDPQGR